MVRKNKVNRIHIGNSDYLEGYTELNKESHKLLMEVSAILNYYSDNYDNLPKNYAPEGLIRVLRDQVKAKIENKSITDKESDNALTLIKLLEENIS